MGRERERKIGFGEGGDLIFVGLVGHGLVFGAVAQPHDSALAFAVDDCGGGPGGDFGSGGVGKIGEENLLPVGRAGAGDHVLHIEDVVLKFFVEDAGLDFIRSLRVQ